MLRKLSRFMLVVLILSVAGLRAQADTVAVGYASFDDLGGGGDTPFALDITNLTSFGGSGVTTLLSFADVTAEATFTDSSMNPVVLGAPDAFSDYTSAMNTMFGTNVMSIVIDGTFAPTVVTLADGSQATIDSTFTATITDPSGSLVNGDFAYINVNTSPIVTGVSEPGTWGLALLSVAGVLLVGRKAAV
jgi:hypothetical protein